MDFLGKTNDFVNRIQEGYGVTVTYSMNCDSIRIYWCRGKKRIDHRCQYLGDDETLATVFEMVEREIQEWIESR